MSIDVEEALRRSRLIPSLPPDLAVLAGARSLAARTQPSLQAQDDLAAARTARRTQTGGAQ